MQKTTEWTKGGEPNNTSLQGYIDVSYKTLCDIFGEPDTSEGYKTDAEWCITTSAGIATIYNYKDGKNYNGEDGTPTEDIRDWHIGGNNTDVVRIVENIVQDFESQAPYTLDTLKRINESYHAEHYINDSDVTYANVYKSLVEISRSNHAPKAGDILMVNGKRQHIDAVENEYLKQGKITVCESAYVPFIRAKVSDSRTTISLCTSGGAWYTTDATLLEKTGEAKKTFCFFGHGGARGNGAVDFSAKVNVWEIVAPKAK